MLRLASVAFGSFIASPATLLEGAAWAAGGDEDADGDSPGFAAGSLAGCVEQPKAKAASRANGMTRTTGFMVDSSLGSYAANYIYTNVFTEAGGIISAVSARHAPADHARMLEVLAQFRVVFKSIRRHYRDVEQRSRITGALLWALSEVAGRPGAQVGELARALAIHQSTASNLVRRLAARGLIARQRRGHDQRAVQLFPTRKGLGVLESAPQPLIGVLQQALADLPPSNLRALHAQLARLIKAMPAKSLDARTAMISEME